MSDRLGTYVVEKKLADGGMGSVFKARSAAGVPVVLKVPHKSDREAMIALADEARTGARLMHPAIVETLDFFQHEGKAVLVVEYIEGKTLFELRKRGPLPPSAVFEVGVQLAGALDAIHTATDEHGRPLQMVHRDISPNNVIVDATGQVKLIDLGIARSAERRQARTMQGMVKGTLRYLAPEIIQGQDHSAATDLWALGVMLWECALGRYAVPGDEMNTVRAAMEGAIMRLNSGEYVDGAVLEALGALVTNVNTRLANARAATNVFVRMAARHPGGRAALAHAAGGAAATMVDDVAPDPTEFMERAALTEQIPHASVAPTLQLPAVDVPIPTATAAPVAPVSVAGITPADDAAPTIQMPMWTPPSPPNPPKVPVVDANAPTRIQPAVSIPSAAPAAPTKSLFLPIVVVDEDGEEQE